MCGALIEDRNRALAERRLCVESLPPGRLRPSRSELPVGKRPISGAFSAEQFLRERLPL